MGLHLIQKQRTPIPQYRETFYDSVFVDLQSLQTRASSVPKNSQTIAIIGILKEQVQSVKTRDSSGNSSAAFFRIAKENIDQNCQDALTLELAKKRGE